MTYKFKLFLVIHKKMAHKYKIIQTLSSFNFIKGKRLSKVILPPSQFVFLV